MKSIVIDVRMTAILMFRVCHFCIIFIIFMCLCIRSRCRSTCKTVICLWKSVLRKASLISLLRLMTMPNEDDVGLMWVCQCWNHSWHLACCLVLFSNFSDHSWSMATSCVIDVAAVWLQASNGLHTWFTLRDFFIFLFHNFFVSYPIGLKFYHDVWSDLEWIWSKIQPSDFYSF